MIDSLARKETTYDTQIKALQQGQFNDPFSFLGLHANSEQQFEIRAFIEGACSVELASLSGNINFSNINDSGLFVLTLENVDLTEPYQLRVLYQDGSEHIFYDPYQFKSSLNQNDMYLFNEGTLEHAYRLLGAHCVEQQGVSGVRFAVWAPNAHSVSVIGEFNHWHANQYFMRKHPASGIWELFLPEVKTEQCYKYAITDCHGNRVEKADPYALKTQQSPGTASVIQKSIPQVSTKKSEVQNTLNRVDAPISIYEVHLGSWKRRENEGGRYLTYRELADDLVNYVKDLGFTHIQLMPISEYPFDGSWGYQPVGLFSPSSRFGSVDDFAYFIESCKKAELGVLLDWVPGHFPSDPHGLHCFDGTHLYEHADKRQGFHPDWNTYIYNYSRPEVQSYLLSNAIYWLEQYQIDGLRVDAVASMLYLDYSREENEWVPNHLGGRENFDAINLLQKVNTRSYANQNDIMMVAEESTAWPGVTNSVDNNGLGFGYKWNMGWMNDTLNYMKRDPIHRQYHHHEMTFSMAYAYSENYILPLSHDEVVHGKGSLLSKMPGDDWQQFANLRAYYAFMYAHPGKKLLFMGAELAPREEWNHNAGLDWDLLNSEAHNGVFKTIQKLNQVYKTSPAFYELDQQPEGFKWIDSDNSQQSIFSFVRFSKTLNQHIVVISHFTGQVYHQFRMGVPAKGVYQVALNTDDETLWGSGVNAVAHTQQLIETQNIASHGFEQSIQLTIPPLSTLYLQFVTG
jgi:1,4-alpha-glucan branching enzyme